MLKTNKLLILKHVMISNKVLSYMLKTHIRETNYKRNKYTGITFTVKSYEKTKLAAIFT